MLACLLPLAAPRYMRAPVASPHQCWPGTAPGRWHGYEWRLQNDSGCPPLERYLHAAPERCSRKMPSPVPGAGPSNLNSCAAVDEALLTHDLRNASVLLIGDSTSAQILWHACETFNRKPSSFIKIDARALNVSLRRYTHRLRSLDNHVCRLPGNLAFGSFSHYGATGPPYWVFAYPLAPWLANNTIGMARHDMPRFRQTTSPRGSDPTLVVVSSGFWDIASWWAHQGGFAKRFSINSTHTAQYLVGVRRLVREVRRAFPRSAVVWRLMHPGMKHSITPAIVARLNAAIRAAAPAWRLPLIDAEKMVSSLSRSAQPNLGKGPPYGTNDGRHLHPWINLALLNLIFNIARRDAHGVSLLYGWRHGGSGTGHLRHNASARARGGFSSSSNTTVGTLRQRGHGGGGSPGHLRHNASARARGGHVSSSGNETNGNGVLRQRGHPRWRPSPSAMFTPSNASDTF